MGKKLLEATVKQTKKCRHPSKYYVSRHYARTLGVRVHVEAYSVSLIRHCRCTCWK